MAHLTPQFSANRTVREYTEQRYLPAAFSYRERVDKSGKDIANWLSAIKENWPALRFGEMTVTKNTGNLIVEVQVYLNELDPEAVRVELFAQGIDGGNPAALVMMRFRNLVGATGGFVYGVTIPMSGRCRIIRRESSEPSWSRSSS